MFAAESSSNGLDGMPEAPATVEVVGYRLAAIDLNGAAEWLMRAAQQEDRPRLIVTLNPEIVVRSGTSVALRSALRHADLTVADGVGLLWAARRAGHILPGRVSGIDLVCRAMELGGSSLRVYFLGAGPGVAERAAAKAQERWGTRVAGFHHGYFSGEAESEQVISEVRSAAPNLLLAGLGEGQEEFLDSNRLALGAKVLVGVGGTLDVLAGEAQRTPAWTRKLHLEWAWRVGLDRRRWHRIPRLLRFVRLVRARTP
ncbi:MAG: WecB/TagA/CpsF family glycosyltransferase [Trueperaceae bacterium]